MNGNPSFRLWKIGTNRVLGIYSGPSANRWGLDSEGPELPANISQAFSRSKLDVPYDVWIVADFDVCPLAPEKPETMQPACIESAKNIVAKPN